MKTLKGNDYFSIGGSMYKTKAIISLSVILFFSIACSNEEQMPSIIIPKDTMVEIMADLQVVESSYALGYLDSLKSGVGPANVNQGVLEKYSISKQRFDTSYNYYLLHPALFNQIYDETINELSQRQAALNK